MNLKQIDHENNKKSLSENFSRERGILCQPYGQLIIMFENIPLFPRIISTNDLKSFSTERSQNDPYFQCELLTFFERITERDIFIINRSYFRLYPCSEGLGTFANHLYKN